MKLKQITEPNVLAKEFFQDKNATFYILNTQTWMQSKHTIHRLNANSNKMLTQN